MDLKAIMDDIVKYMQSDDFWIMQVFLIVLLTMIANFICRRLLVRLDKQFQKTKNPWDDALLEASQKPLSYLIWILGILFAAEIVQSQSDSVIFKIVDPLRSVSVIALIAWFLIRLINNVEENFVKGDHNVEKVDETTAAAIAKLLRITVIVTCTLVILQTLDFEVSGILAFGGIGGIVAGMAAKDLLANFFGGLMIYMDRPFAIGNWIRSPDQNIEGVVEYIGWRLTRIRTFDKRPLYVPNSTFTHISVENPSRMTNRRIYETIGMRYDDSAVVEQVLKDVEDMLKAHPDIDQTQTLMVNFNAFAASSLDFFIYTFTKTTNWEEFHGIKQDVLLKILRIIHAHGADVAYPTQTLHLADNPLLELANTDSRSTGLK